MICKYNKEQITPTISANQIPAISNRLNQALLYKRVVIFGLIQPTRLIEVFSPITNNFTRVTRDEKLLLYLLL